MANSLGAGVLIAAYASAKRQNASLKLYGVSDRVETVLRTCGSFPRCSTCIRTRRVLSRASDEAGASNEHPHKKEEAMKIQTREVGGITVLDVMGEMYGGPENMELVNTVTDLAKEKKLDLLVNLSKVKWISSTGLGILVSARSRLAKEGGVVKLCQPNDRVLDILMVTRLNMIFDVFSTEEEALASFKK